MPLSAGTRLGPYEILSASFVATSWSPDGTKLAGYVTTTSSGTSLALATYDLTTRRMARRLDVAGRVTQCLPDSRRLVLFSETGESLIVVDTETGSTRHIEVTLPLREAGGAFAVSPDGRTIFYGGRREEADIRILERLKDDG